MRQESFSYADGSKPCKVPEHGVLLSASLLIPVTGRFAFCFAAVLRYTLRMSRKALFDPRNCAWACGWYAALLMTGGLGAWADAAVVAIDPFAPEEEIQAAVRETLARPTRFSLETHTLKPSADATPRTLTFRLNTVSGEVFLFNGRAFVDVSDGSSANSELFIDLAASPTPEEAAARRRMEAILLPEVSFRETRVEDAMQFLQDASKEHDPEKKGFVFVH